jgi:hypothetical protein
MTFSNETRKTGLHMQMRIVFPLVFSKSPRYFPPLYLKTGSCRVMSDVTRILDASGIFFFFANKTFVRNNYN